MKFVDQVDWKVRRDIVVRVHGRRRCLVHSVVLSSTGALLWARLNWSHLLIARMEPAP